MKTHTNALVKSKYPQPLIGRGSLCDPHHNVHQRHYNIYPSPPKMSCMVDVSANTFPTYKQWDKRQVVVRARCTEHLLATTIPYCQNLQYIFKKILHLISYMDEKRRRWVEPFHMETCPKFSLTESSFDHACFQAWASDEIVDFVCTTTAGFRQASYPTHSLHSCKELLFFKVITFVTILPTLVTFGAGRKI